MKVEAVVAVQTGKAAHKAVVGIGIGIGLGLGLGMSVSVGVAKRD